MIDQPKPFLVLLLSAFASFSRRMRLWKPGRGGTTLRIPLPHRAVTPASASITTAQASLRHRCGLGSRWHTDRFQAGSAPTEALLIHHVAELSRLSDHVTFGRIARRRPRHADRQIHAGQRRLPGVYSAPDTAS